TASLQISSTEAPPSRFALSRAACARLLPLLGRTARLHLSRPSGDLPLVWHEPSWALRLRVTEAPREAPAGPGGMGGPPPSSLGMGGLPPSSPDAPPWDV